LTTHVSHTQTCFVVALTRSAAHFRVTRTVIETQQDTAVIAPSGPQSGLDKMLSVLQGPQTISTVVKSSIDWQNFKEAEGLEDELAVAQKEGCTSCTSRHAAESRHARTGISRARSSWTDVMCVSTSISGQGVEDLHEVAEWLTDRAAMARDTFQAGSKDVSACSLCAVLGRAGI
jgi:tryptophan synthase beta subunit